MAVLALSSFMIDYKLIGLQLNTDDTPYDLEITFDDEEYSVTYLVVNGNTDNVEMDIPLDRIDGVFMIYVNDQVVDDERVILHGNKIIVNYGQNIESVKVVGSHDLGGLENENAEAISKFTQSPTVHIITEDGHDMLSQHRVLIDLDYTNSVTFVNDSADSVRIQEIGENKIVDIPQDAWRTKSIASGEEITMQFNSTGHYEFNVKKVTNFLDGYLEHHETGEIVVLSNDTNSLSVEIRAKMAQSIVGSDFRKGVGLVSVGSGSAEPGITIGIHEKFENDDAERFYYEKYRNMIPFDVPIRIEFGSPAILN